MDGSIKILNLLYSADDASAAYELIFDAVEIARGLDKYQPFASMVAPLQEIYYTLQDMALQLNSFKDSLDFEPGLLDHIEKRLYDIEKLENKYGKEVKELLDYLEKCQQDLEVLVVSQDSQEELQQKTALLEAEYYKEANCLSQLREKAGALLENRVYDELQQLDMPHVKFKVDFSARETPGPNGIDTVDFFVFP